MAKAMRAAMRRAMKAKKSVILDRPNSAVNALMAQRVGGLTVLTAERLMAGPEVSLLAPLNFRLKFIEASCSRL